MAEHTPFDRAVAVVLEREGVFANEPADPGGETWFGISRAAHPHVDPWPPSKAQAVTIYRHEYWDACQCDLWPWPLALAMFDCAVNQGPRIAVRLLQQAVFAVPDRVIGPDTIRRTLAAAPAELLATFMAYRLERYTTIKASDPVNYALHVHGWFCRVILITLAGMADTPVQAVAAAADATTGRPRSSQAASS
jgi:lysozyme family protein